MKILDGKKISDDIKDEISLEVKHLESIGVKRPHLAAILIGNDGASETYVNSKVKACNRVGFKSTLIRLENTVSEEDLILEINKINKDSDIDGLIVQLPVPKHINTSRITESIDPNKDVDGFHPINIGKMMLNLPSYLPATPSGILELLKRYNVQTKGKHCVVIGRSHIVGSPMSILMSRNNEPGNCTVTLTHSYTEDLKQICSSADILIVALGRPDFVTSDMVKEGACIIDVGITRVPSDKAKKGWVLKGDVSYNEVENKCSYITPVPGGVGPMTIAMLLKNTLYSVKRQFL